MGSEMCIRDSNQDDVLCWTSDQVTVCVDMNDVKQKVRVPDWMREGLAKLAPA